MDEIIQTLSPALSARTLTREQREAFEKGLALLEAHPRAKAFVESSRRFRDYHRRVRQMLTYLQTLDLTDGTAAYAASLARRRGRPTKAQQAARAEQRRREALEETRKSLFPDLKPDLSLQPITFRGIVANPNGESIAATMPKLFQLRPFLSKELQERVNAVRDLRNEMAAKAEQAKTMAEANERSKDGQLYSESEIAALAERAVEIESRILPGIYTAVDREIGECYLRLSKRTGDPEYIAYVESTFSVSPHDIRAQFKPFYEKASERDPLFAQAVADKIAADRPEIKAQRDAAAKHKAEADALVKYIIRKDKAATAKRAKGLEERIARLRESYSDIVTEDELMGYEAILARTIEELNA